MADKKKNEPKAPSGAQIERKSGKFVFSWKLREKYSKLSYYSKFGKKKAEDTLKKNTTKKSRNIDLKDYYPFQHTVNRKKKDYPTLKKVSFGVRGYHDKKWSDWTKETYKIEKPKKPRLWVSHDSESNQNQTTFSWEADFGKHDANSTKNIVTNFKYWTCLIPNTNLDPKNVKSADWKGPTMDSTDNIKTSGYKPIIESQPFRDGYSYTRYFKVIACGPAGNSEPAYAKFVYAYPTQAKNVNATMVKLSDNRGYRVTVEWTLNQTNSNPVDSISVEYAIEMPEISHTDVDGVRKFSMSVPGTIESWTAAAAPKDDRVTNNNDKDAVSFIINREIDLDKCVFVRVKTVHDNKPNYSAVVFAKRKIEENGKTNYEIREALKAPSAFNANINDNIATITLTNGSDITESFVAIYYRTDADPTARPIGIWPPGNTAAITVQLPDLGSANNFSLGMRALVADSYKPITPNLDSVTEYGIGSIKMGSGNGIIWDDRPVPKPPSNITLSSPRNGVVRVTWDWTWTDANSVELSWADHDDAWESTDAPSTHMIENTRACAWNVAGLEVGTWYFRIRLCKTDGDSVTYGTYSAINSIKLASSPETPVLTVTPEIVPPDGSINCYWAFTASDGDEQLQAEIREAVLSDQGEPIDYIDIGMRANNEQSKAINLSLLDWEPGSSHYLAVKIITASGEESANWSTPKLVTILEPIECTITDTSLEIVTVVDDDETDPPTTSQRLSLTDLPLQVSATGAGPDGVITYIIERADNYMLDRPDESTSTGYDGETIALIRKTPNNTYALTTDTSVDTSKAYYIRSGSGTDEDPYEYEEVTPASDADPSALGYYEVSSFNYDEEIGLDDLINPLDDGASYNLIAIAQDSNGQRSDPDKSTINFSVNWRHQAIMPTANVQADQDDLVTFITPILPEEGYEVGDTCDIYRLSTDPPELIIENAEFGTTYVDPYPALGEMGGHRVVYKTINGDYITGLMYELTSDTEVDPDKDYYIRSGAGTTEDPYVYTEISPEEGSDPSSLGYYDVASYSNSFAWTDYDSGDGDIIDTFATIVNFGDDQLILPYDLSLSSKWSKDFTMTKYLGGSVEGDWNPAIERTGTVKTRVAVQEDPDLILALRRLANYPGICHIRTPDGSSFAANVEVSEDREERKINMVASFSLDITKVDSEGFDGVTYEQWIGN